MALLRTLCASAVLALAGGAAFYAGTDGLRAYTTESARRIAVREHPVAIPAVALETDSGARLDLGALRGRWLLVDFIYTRCPSYCRALGAELAQLQDRLAGPLARREVALLSISFDAAHDSPAELAAYLRRARSRGAGWVAARPLGGDGLDRLEHAFGITVISDGAGGYVHNAALHLVDPRGRLVSIFDAGDGQRAAQTVLARLER
ncbi:MAG: hypothetical protein HONDAALG_02168 [Gammaproteobacteria bacterium]|nr:hypothetical protein [Gammaproteobacteria bacterium]